MTLKEKDLVNTFYYSLPNNGSTEGINSTTRRYAEAKQCALIAEDFAIEFAEWNSYKYKYLENKGWFNGSYELEMGIFLSSKELLEIYKKEKGL
jgi:hypothetical protein